MLPSRNHRRRAPVVRILVAALLVPLVQPPPVAAQEELTLERLTAHPDWVARSPEDPYWADDGESIYFEQKRMGSDLRDLFEVSLGGDVEEVADARRGDISVSEGDWNRARTAKVYAREGDVYLRDATTGAVRQLTRTAADERGPFFMADQRRIAFERDRAFFIRDLATGLEVQAAEVRAEKDPAKEDDEEGYLDRQQERLFDVVRRDKEKEREARDRARAEQQADPTRAPLPFYLGDDVRVTGTVLSPSGDWLLVSVADAKRDEGKGDLMPNYVTESGYLETEEVRPKVGTGDPRGERLMLLDLRRHETHPLDWSALPGIADDPLAELREAAKARSEAEKKAGGEEDDEGTEEDAAETETVAAEEANPEEQVEEAVREEIAGEEIDEGMVATGETEEEGAAVAGDGKTEGAKEDEEVEEDEKDEPEPRAVQVGDAQWNDAGTRVAVMAFSRDNKDRWIATIDLDEPALVPRERLTDPGWINWDFNDMGWLPDGDTLWVLSEESGWSHLYLHAMADDSRRQLTQGEYTVGNVTVSPDGRQLYFLANRERPAVWEVYRLPTSASPALGAEPERLTRLEGLVEYELSPQGDRLLLSHSTTLRPPELFVQGAAPGAAATRLTETVTPEFAGIDWVEPEIVAVPSSHAPRPIYSRLYLPDDFDPARAEPYPAVFFVHGAGYLQNSHAGWSYYYREMLFHTFLARRGFVVLDMDFRASAGYGRDWRTAIYQRMGHPELEDLEDGIAWLTAEHNVDPDRVGVYGGSYGGFMTLMALFRRPGLFAAGAALRPVTDWAHYNHEYTSNILNTPEIDPEAFERSSPIEHAAGLEDPLLIIHGVLDDNVLFEDTVRLAQRLIELEKEDWWVAMYPVEPHAMQEPTSWLDAYRRIWDLFERELAPAGP